MERLVNLVERLILTRIDIKKILRFALYLFLALLGQNMLLNRLRILDVCPLVLPAVAVAVGMFEGAGWGCVLALILGVFADMGFVENSVTFTLLFPLLAFGSAFISEFFINRRFFAFMGAALLALAITAVVQMLLVAVKDSFSLVMLRTAFLQTLWSLPLCPLAYYPAAHMIR